MLSRRHDPIIAQATAPGRGAVGIVRISGHHLAALARALCGRDLPPRQACYLPFCDAQGQVIDKGLALFFPAPHSYTGEDVLELHAHGGAVVLQLLLARCLEAAHGGAHGAGEAILPGLRLARPGEFTERAFLNNKLDLAQAEAVADLIDASTEAAARSAGQSLAGAFSAHIHALRDALVALRTLVEATLDFPEEDIDFLQQADATGQLQRLRQQLAQVLAQSRQGALLREGIKVVLAGQPNAGKSSLLNALAGAELAIVTPIAGTTRDKVQQTIQIEGVPLHIVDTAGLRDGMPAQDAARIDPVEQAGIQRAWAEIAAADCVLFLHDLTRLHTAPYQRADAAIAQRLQEKVPPQVPLIPVYSKADCLPQSAAASAPARADGGIALSAHTGAGLDALRQRLLAAAGWQHGGGEGVFLARARHIEALHACADHLQAASAHLQEAGALELLAEELRLAQQALGSITGEFGVEDLLGAIFSSFCIGK